MLFASIGSAHFVVYMKLSRKELIVQFIGTRSNREYRFD
jgi:hypothetical protein